MKLFYWSNGWNNFGDELNPWLIPKMLPRIHFDQNIDEYFIGIGTLLNQRLPKKGIKYVVGSGVGYGQPPVLDETFRIYGGRGPLSCRMLGLDEIRFGLTDPAMFIPTLFHKKIGSTGRVAYMPHCLSHAQADWASIARNAGMDYISPTNDVEVVISQIAGAKMLVTEALHGAILADAFRIPWIPVTSNGVILEFKWQDWLASVDLEYRPQRIHEIIDGRGTTRFERQKDNVKRIAMRFGFGREDWTAPRKALTGSRELAEVHEALVRLTRGERAILSRDTSCATAISRLQAAFEAMQRDYALRD